MTNLAAPALPGAARTAKDDEDLTQTPFIATTITRVHHQWRGSAVIHAKGKTGQVQFDGQYVTITRKGLLARSVVGKGEKRLHVSQISAVRWKPAGFAVNGYIQFSLPGGNETRSRFGNQTQAAVKDENSVVFTRAQQPEFEQLRAAIEQTIATHHTPQHAAPTAAPSAADELAKLGALMQQGLISHQEFETAKARILGL